LAKHNNCLNIFYSFCLVSCTHVCIYISAKEEIDIRVQRILQNLKSIESIVEKKNDTHVYEDGISYAVIKKNQPETDFLFPEVYIYFDLL